MSDVRTAVERPGYGELLAGFVAVSVLTFGLPQDWFREAEDTIGEQSGGTLVVVIFGTLSLALVSRLVGHEDVVVEAFRREPLVLLLPVLAVVSAIWAADPSTAGRRAGAFLLTTLLGYYFASRYEIREIVVLVAAALAIGLVLNVIWINLLPRYGLSDAGLRTGILSDKNSLGRTTALGTVVMLLAARVDPRRRVLWWVLLAAHVALLFASNSKTALASTTLTLGLVAVATGFRARSTLYGAVALSTAAAMVVAVLFATANLVLVTDLLDRDITLTGRTDLWAAIWPNMVDAMPFGFGWNSFWGPWFSPAHDVYVRFPWAPPDAHNDWMDLWLALGPTGALLYAGIFLRGFVRASRFLRMRPTIEGLWPISILSMMLLVGITESGVPERNIHWLVLVIVSVQLTAARHEDFVRQVARRSAPREGGLTRRLVGTGASPGAGT